MDIKIESRRSAPVSKIVTMEQEEVEDFEMPGHRLTHLLKKIGFEEQRGLITDLYNFLRETRPEEFGDLTYGAVRGWFNVNAPPMRKIDAILDALKTQYPIEVDEKYLKTWWKVGGHNPFLPSLQQDELEKLNQEVIDLREKMKFVTMAIVREEIGDMFEKVPPKDLEAILDVTNQFTKDFSDPYMTTPPNYYLRAIIRDYFRNK